MCEATTIASAFAYVFGGAEVAGGAAAAGSAASAGTAASASASAASLTTAQYASLALTAASAATAAAGAYQQSKTAKAIAENNANTADLKAKDALARGDRDAQAIGRQTRRIQGEQRAALSARGLDISEGTPADLIDQTDFFGQADQATARTNARKEAYGYKTQQSNFQAESYMRSPWLEGGSSLLAGAGAVSDRWTRYSGRV